MDVGRGLCAGFWRAASVLRMRTQAQAAKGGATTAGWLAAGMLLALGTTGCGGARARELDNYSAGKGLGAAAYTDAQAVMVLDEAELTYVFDVGRFQPYAELRRHRIIRILTEGGRKRFSRIYIPMSRRVEPRDIKGQLIKHNGARTELQANATLDFNRFSGSDKAASLYNEPAARGFAVPGLQVGDAVEFQSVSIIRDPRWVEPLVAGDGEWDLPVTEARLSVVAAPGYDVDFRVTVRGVLKELEPERVPARVFDPVKGGSAKLDATRFIWAFNDLPPSFAEPRGTTAEAAATQVHVQMRRFALPENPSKAFVGYGTWDDVAAWFRDLMGKPDGSGSGLAPNAKDARTKKDKLKAVQKGCSKLQLVDVGGNLGTLKAHKAGEVMGAGKGDSKDVAWACLSATRAANLDAFPVLLARRGHRAGVPDLPTPAAFDHVIIAVPGQGTYEFFDPTGIGVPSGRALPWSQGVDALVVRPDGVDRVKTPEDTAEQNVREANYKLALSTDGMVEGSAVFKLTGQDAAFARSVLRDLKGADRMTALSEWLAGGDQKLTWADAQLSDEDPDPDAALRLLVTFDRKPLGGLSGRLALRMSELVGKPFPFLWRDGRATPVDLGYRLTDRLICSVQMPDGHGLSGRPRDLTDDTPFTRVEQRYLAADGALVLRRERTVKEPVVLPAQYDQLKDIHERIWANLDQSVPVVPGGERGKEYGADPF